MGLVVCHRARQRSFQVNPLNRSSALAALAEQVGKVLPRNVAFVLDLSDLVLALAELFGREFEGGLELRGGHAEDTADFGGDTGGVEVDVVHLCEGDGDLAGEAGGECVWDLGDEIRAGQEDCGS